MSKLLYSYRRCPYAMRARMALVSAQIQCDVHDVEFKNKQLHLLEISPKATVPVLQLEQGQVIDESLEIIRWALEKNDPDGWLDCDLISANNLIKQNDGAFKGALDRYKYPTRYKEEDSLIARDEGVKFLTALNKNLTAQNQLIGDRISLADIAIFPFVRQFSSVDKPWFDALPLPYLQAWLSKHLASALFETIIKNREARYLLLGS